MKKKKESTIKEVVDRIADKDIPMLMEAIMGNKEMATENRVRMLRRLGAAQDRFRMIQITLEEG